MTVAAESRLVPLQKSLPAITSTARPPPFDHFINLRPPSTQLGLPLTEVADVLNVNAQRRGHCSVCTKTLDY